MPSALLGAAFGPEIPDRIASPDAFGRDLRSFGQETAGRYGGPVADLTVRHDHGAQSYRDVVPEPGRREPYKTPFGGMTDQGHAAADQDVIADFKHRQIRETCGINIDPFSDFGSHQAIKKRLKRRQSQHIQKSAV